MQKSKAIKVQFNSYGDSLISKSDFVNQIVSEIDVKAQRSLLSQIKFDYDKFKNWNFNTVEEKNIGTITLKFEKEKTQNPDAEIYVHINLLVYKNNKKIDQIIVYKEENYSEALVTTTQFFYLDTNLNLWILGINEDEEGIKIMYSNQYKIDNDSGKIKLIKNGKFNDLPTKKKKIIDGLGNIYLKN